MSEVTYMYFLRTMNTIRMIMMLTITRKMTPPTTPPTIAPIADAVREGEEGGGMGRREGTFSIIHSQVKSFNYPLACHCYSFPASDL